MRQIILDTETTGLEISDGHRIIEIGCVELIDRRLSHKHFHQYLNPEREIEDGALEGEVHGPRVGGGGVAGDLDPDYLEFLVTVINKPLIYVRGNHDINTPITRPEWTERR